MHKRHTKPKQNKSVVLPVGVAEEIVRLIRRAAAGQPLTTQVKRELSQVAAETEVRIRLVCDSQMRMPQKLVRAVLRGMTYLVHFRREIKEMANALMGIRNQ